MSTINTSGIDVNYPIPGVNNSSQGMRDNFAAIKNNINIAGNELTDLQNKVVLKSALANSTLNNDMANALISNATTLGFRASTYNLGNALAGTVLIDVSLGDVQIGTIVENVALQFGGWAPSGTQSNVELQLTVSNANAVISLPSEVISSNNNFGVTTIENYANIANVATLTIPYGVDQLDFRLSSVDCGNTINIEPYNRPRITTQVQQRTPIPTGYPGDVPGTVALGEVFDQLTIANSNASDYFTTANTSQLYTDLPIIFTGVSMEANVVIGTTYYIRNVVSNTTFTISSTIGGANVNLAGNTSPTSSMYGNPVTYSYTCTGTYDSTEYSKVVSDTTVTTNIITLNNTTGLTVNSPIIFSGEVFGGLLADTVYYIKSIPNGTSITVSRSRTNGISDSVVVLSTATGTCNATIFVGPDIWKRSVLSSW